MELDFSIFAHADTWISLLTLTALEVVLGIDNIIFITILAGKLPKEKQVAARRLGLGVALFARIALLLAITWVMQLEGRLFDFLGSEISGKDLILILGGLFLLGKASHEIYENVERPSEHQPKGVEQGLGDKKKPSKNFMLSFIIQVSLLDIVFSLDSVITAVGMVDHIIIMVIAVLIAVGIMMAFASPIGNFVQQHASIRVLALAFLVLIGFLLITEGFDKPIEKGYIYFAMAFSLGVQLLNMRMKSRVERWKRRGNNHEDQEESQAA